MKTEEQGVLAALAVVAVLCNLAFNIENNDSRLVYVPKREFVRVMSEIVSGPGTQQAAVGEGEERDGQDESDLAGYRPVETARTRITKQIDSKLRRYSESVHGKKGYVKSDSLYYLQKSMEARESAYKARYRPSDSPLNADHVI